MGKVIFLISEIERLPYVEIRNIRETPKRMGVYFVVSKNGEIVYIGKSRNFFNRWNTDKQRTDFFRSKYPDCRIHLLYTDSENEALYIEKTNILHYKPVQNICFVKRWKNYKPVLN